MNLDYLSDRELLVHLIMGDLPRRGWDRRRAIRRRLAQIVLVAFGLIGGVVAVSGFIVVFFAAADKLP